MGWFLIVGSIFLLGIVIAVVCDHFVYDDMCELCAIFISCVCFFALIVMGGSLINKEARFDAFVRDYESTKALVENYRGTDYGNMQALTEKVIVVNEYIARHKAFLGNKLSGVWYSEKIASLDPITFAYPDAKNLK